MADEETTGEVEVFVGEAKGRSLILDNTDAFAKDGNELGEISGMNQNVRRKLNRSMEKAFTGADGAKSKQIETQKTVDGYNLYGVVLPPHNLDYLAKIYEMSAPHYAAVKAKVSNIAGLGFDLVESHAARRKLDQSKSESKKDSIRRNIDREKDAVYEWLDNANAEDEFGEILQKVWTDYEAVGNGYLEIGRALDGSVKYIGHIPATTMRVRKDRDGFVQMVAEKVIFFRNFGDDETTDRIGNDPRPNEVIHLKKYSPTNTYYGVPDVIAAQQAIVGNEFSARFNLDYFENKAVPRYVVVLKGSSFSTTSEQAITEFFETGLKGQNHRTLIVPLPPDTQDRKVDFDMKPVEAGMQDSSFNNFRRGNLEEILMAHRVPITKIAAGNGISLAAARDLDKTFKEQVCRPEQRMFEKKLNKIVKEVTDIVLLKLNELSLTDEDTQSKIDERYLRMQVVVPNEVRRRWGWPGLPGGDKPVELKPQQAAEQNAQASGNRTRDQQRSGNSPDTSGEARKPKGEGRAQS